MAAFNSKKLFIVFMAMLSMFFLAVIFQNFSFKKDDHAEVYGALQGAISTSDKEHAEKRKFAEPEEEKKGRRINTIHDSNPGLAVEESEPVSIEFHPGTIKK